MLRRPTLALIASAALFLPAATRGADHANTLALDYAMPSFSAAFGGESPAGTGLSHVGEASDGDPLFGLSFEYRATRHVGIRAGLLRGDLALRGASVCAPSPCTFTVGSTRVIISDADWSVDEDASFRMPFVEIPFAARASPRVEVFAGPTIAWPSLGDVEAPGLNGLTLEASAQSPAYGAHLGLTVDLDLQQRWVAGVIARMVRAEVDFSVGQPFVAVLDEPFAAEDDLLTVGVMVGRRFGG